MSNDLLRTLRKITEGEFEVFGELGEDGPGNGWYLARRTDDGQLVALHLRSIGSPGGRPEYDLDVAQELSSKVSVGLGDCPACGVAIRRWMRFCVECGAPLELGEMPSARAPDRGVLLAQVRAAAADDFDVLGEMPWSGGGIVYFAIERATARVVRLRLANRGDEYELGLTRAMVPLEEPRVTAHYVTEVPRSSSKMGPPGRPSAPRGHDQVLDPGERAEATPSKPFGDPMLMVKVLAVVAAVQLLVIIGLLLR